MTVPRSTLIDHSRPGCYHLLSRCVRRAFLCGDGYDHRKERLERDLQRMAGIFAVDVLAYAIMSNHFHLVVCNRPDRAETWSAREVAERWAAVHPKRDRDGCELPPDEDHLARCASNPGWVDTQRTRLACLSEFMKAIKNPFARDANKEDDCTGAFWEGRFRSNALLDQAAVVACMTYVDLNPIRAAIATTPEDSEHTSIQLRIETRENHRRVEEIRQQHEQEPPPQVLQELGLKPSHSPQAPLWIAPIEHCTCRPGVQTPLDLDSYLELVDATGRIIRGDKRGAIPAHLAPILERLDIDLDQWLDAVASAGRFLGTAIGSAAARATEAARRGVRWIVDKARFYRNALRPQTAT